MILWGVVVRKKNKRKKMKQRRTSAISHEDIVCFVAVCAVICDTVSMMPINVKMASLSSTLLPSFFAENYFFQYHNFMLSGNVLVRASPQSFMCIV